MVKASSSSILWLKIFECYSQITTHSLFRADFPCSVNEVRQLGYSHENGTRIRAQLQFGPIIKKLAKISSELDKNLELLEGDFQNYVKSGSITDCMIRARRVTLGTVSAGLVSLSNNLKPNRVPYM